MESRIKFVGHPLHPILIVSVVVRSQDGNIERDGC
jgi:hypothetical protein